LGLSARQFAYLVAGWAGGYALWQHAPELPTELRAGLAGFCVLVALLVALVRPAGRGLDDWVFVLARYAATPKRCVWRVREPGPDPGARPPDPRGALPGRGRGARPARAIRAPSRARARPRRLPAPPRAQPRAARAAFLPRGAGRA